MMKARKKICGAKTRAGTPCKCAPMENGRCYRHGGATPKGADSPHFIHGGYSKYVHQEIADKVIAFQDADPFDLTDELALARALLADYMSRVEMPMGADTHDTASMLVDRIRKTVESINRIKNDSALTAAEITYLAARAADVVARYIDDPTQQAAFIQDLFGGLAGANPTIPANVTIEEN
jgi:hypothetical protein